VQKCVSQKFLRMIYFESLFFYPTGIFSK